MANIKLHVKAFDIEIELPCTDEDEFWEEFDTDTIGNRAIEEARIVSATYDVPEDEDEAKTDDTTKIE